MASGNWWRWTLTSVVAGLLGAICFPAAAIAEDKPETQVDGSKGGFTIRSGDSSVTFGAYVWLRGTADDRQLYDADAKDTLGYGVEDGFTPAFDVNRIRLSFRGTMLAPWARYNFSFELGRTSGDSASKIKDGYLELGREAISVRAGQYKVPFGLQELAPDWGVLFVDRSLADATFAPSRDVGVMASGTARGKKLGYAAGAFNGSGEAKQHNNRALMWTVRLWADPAGEYRLSESAVDAPAKSTFHVGAAVRGGDAMKGGTAGVVQDTNTQTAVGLELAYKGHRSFLSGETFWQRDQVHNPQALPDRNSFGWYAQGAFMVLARRLELAARYSEVDPSRSVVGDHQSELRGGINYYWKAHNLKLQTDAARLTFEPNAPGRVNRLPDATGRKLADFQLRLQLQLYY